MPSLLTDFRWLKLPQNLSAPDHYPEKTIAARALHAVLLVALPFAALFLVALVPAFAIRKAAATAFWGVIAAGAVICLALLRRGYVRLSSWIFLSTAWLILALVVVLSGGIRSPAVLSHLAVIVVSVWLLGRREAICIAALSLAFGLSMAIMESIGLHLPEYFPVPPVAAWLFAVGLVSLTIFPLASVNHLGGSFASHTGSTTW
jgi:hypothetical protein